LEDLINKIKLQIELSSKAEDYLLSIATEKNIQKGTTLIREGQVVNKIYFVKSGCLRSFCTDKEGKEHTLLFAIKNWWISDYIAIHDNTYATLTVESLTDAAIIEFNAKELDEIHSLFPEFEPLQRQNLERHVVSLQKRILNQLQLSALERYELFLKQYPDIEKHTRNYHIASFLGITQQSLSRLRVEISKK
jgi:CRP-like cAMP-binding protein